MSYIIHICIHKYPVKNGSVYRQKYQCFSKQDVNITPTQTNLNRCLSATSHSDVQYIERLWSIRHYVMRPTNYLPTTTGVQRRNMLISQTLLPMFIPLCSLNRQNLLNVKKAHSEGKPQLSSIFSHTKMLSTNSAQYYSGT